MEFALRETACMLTVRCVRSGYLAHSFAFFRKPCDMTIFHFSLFWEVILAMVQWGVPLHRFNFFEMCSPSSMLLLLPIYVLSRACMEQLMCMLPIGAATVASSYKRLLLCTIAVNVLWLYGRHGKPRFNTEVR